MNSNNLSSNLTMQYGSVSQPIKNQVLSYQNSSQNNYRSNQAKQAPQQGISAKLDSGFKQKNKAMYNSSMTFGNKSNNGGVSLFSFGRQVNQSTMEKDSSQPNQYSKTNNSEIYNTPNQRNQGGLLSKDPKMAASAIFPMNNSQQSQMDRFPYFNIKSNPSSTISSNSSSNTSSQPKGNQNPKQKRDKELMEIKKQLDELNKKMMKIPQPNNSTQTTSANRNPGTNEPSIQSKPTKPAVVSQSAIFQTNSYSNSNSSFSNKFNHFKNHPSQPMTSLDELYSQKKKNQPNPIKQNNYMEDKNPNKFSNPTPIQQKPYNNSYTQPKSTYQYQKPTVKQETISYNSDKKDKYSNAQNYDYSYKSDSKSNNISKNLYEQPKYKSQSTTQITTNKLQKQNPVATNYNSFSSTTKNNYSQFNLLSNNNKQEVAGGFKKKKTVTIQEPNKIENKLNYKENVYQPTQNYQNYAQNSYTATENQNIRKIQSFDFVDFKAPTVQKLDKIKYSDFQIGKKMGKGMFGQVLLVKHKATGWVCGLKVMEKKIIKQEKYAGQIARELSIQFYLSHRNILQLFGYFEDQKNFYLLIQFCVGGQLLQRLRQQRRMNQRDVSLIIRQICQGVDYIHKQLIIHRDIKPENILFNMGVVKICDFGWSVYRGFGMRKTASGSPLYYPPQIVKGEQYDDKIDIWCIGMMAYQCIMGKIPFRVYTQMDLGRIVSDQITFPEWVDVTDQAKDFILKTLKKKPQQRMQIRQMLRHPFITKHQEAQLPKGIIEQFKRVLS